MTAPRPVYRAEPVPVRSLVEVALRLARQWWPHLAALSAACGVLAATIAGALGVGAGLQRGLERLALARLGGIESAVISDGFFHAGLAAETAARLRPQTPGDATAQLVPAIVLEVSLERAGNGTQAGLPVRATLLACDDLAALGFSPPTTDPTPGPVLGPVLGPAPDTVAINAPLAEAIGARPGDAVVLRIAKAREVPSDSPLGRRTTDSSSRRLQVAEILPADGIGEFSLRPTQVTGALAVTSLATAQAIVRGDAAVANTLLASVAADSLRAALRPTLDDVGLSLERPREGDAWRLSSRRLLLPPEADRITAEVLGPVGARPTLAFLVTAMTPLVAGQPGPASIPYSTVVGLDSVSLPVGDLVDDEGRLLPLPGPEEIVIDRWMADDLAAQGTPVVVGDVLELRYFLPETLHGRVEEATTRLRISGIAAMRGAAVARDLVPEVEGITDEASIADWDPPFPFDRSRIRATPPHDEDDRYWKAHGATPKAFVALQTSRRLAGSRFGITTAWHLPADAITAADEVRASLAATMDRESLGMQVVPLRWQAQQAARGSTPFGSLLLALSSFVVSAWLVLQWLLFSLLVAARRRDVGILSAIGWPAARVIWLLLCVGGMAAIAGIVVGTVLGPLWAAALLAWLASAWNTGVVAGSKGAFGRAAPVFSAPMLAAAIPGGLVAGLVSLFAIGVAARRAARLSPLSLLKGGDIDPLATRSVASGITMLLAVVGPLVAVGLAWWGRHADPQAAVGLFFASGFAALTGLLAVVKLLLSPHAGRRRPLRTLFGLAWRGLMQGRSRAFSVAAIVACAEFLIVSVSSFAVHPPTRPHDRASPTGGWTHIASFGTPTGIDPADPDTRESLGLSDAQRSIIEQCAIARIRSSAGDDASCVNLYAPSQPTVLGLGPSFIDRGGFRFVDHAATDAAGQANPWTLLDRAGDRDAPIPAILDQATAQWALKLGGMNARFDLPVDGGRATLEIVGLLDPGILQGYVLVSEQNFTRLFPRQSGFALALVDAGPDDSTTSQATQAIAAAWADASVTVTLAIDRLRSLQAVQNTFLAGFQALGTLGLVLGTAGVAAVQFQSVLQRLGALGLMSAVGFTAGRMRLLVVLETLVMVLVGLLVGTLAGCLAVMPAFAAGRAGVPLGWIGCTWGLTLAAALAAGLLAAQRTVRIEPAKVLACAD